MGTSLYCIPEVNPEVAEHECFLIVSEDYMTTLRQWVKYLWKQTVQMRSLANSLFRIAKKARKNKHYWLKRASETRRLELRYRAMVRGYVRALRAAVVI